MTATATYATSNPSEASDAVTITLLLDTTAPVITLTGDNPLTIVAGSAYTELGATATDNIDGDISNDIVINASAVNTGVAGSYSVTYDVSDNVGNPAVQVIRTVIVTVPLSVKDVAGSGISIYPNPAGEVVRISNLQGNATYTFQPQRKNPTHRHANGEQSRSFGRYFRTA